MKYLALAVLSLVVVNVNAQGDKNLPSNASSELRLIIGIVITVVVIVAIYLLLRKEDK